MGFADGRNVDANIKAYKPQVMFNQATRTSLGKFSEVHGLDVSELRELFRLKAQDTNRPLIPLSSQNKWREIIQPKAKAIVKWSMSDHPTREVLVLFDRVANVMKLYKMTDVLSQLDYFVGFTPKGNIKIGSSFQLQRKGGDGNVKSYPKTDSRHPSNHIQIKLNIKSFLSELEPFCYYRI